MELVTLIGKPLFWTRERVHFFWDRYVYLAGVRQENEMLRAKIVDLYLQLSTLHEEAAEIARLRAMHSFQPPEQWTVQGGRVISQRFGPHAVVETILVNRGTATGASPNTPVISPVGVVGRVLRSSPSTSQVLMITDPNSKIAVVGRTHRTQGILVGQGPDMPLQLQYVPLNDVLEEGEILVTSGMDGIFPKGLPVARVQGIFRSSVSLFQTVHAVPTVDLRNLEEVLLVFHDAQASQESQLTRMPME